MAPFTISNFRLDPAMSLNMFCFSSAFSTPYDLPMPGGPDMIIARTLDVATASAISSRIENLAAILSIACSSDSVSAGASVAVVPLSSSRCLMYSPSLTIVMSVSSGTLILTLSFSVNPASSLTSTVTKPPGLPPSNL